MAIGLFFCSGYYDIHYQETNNNAFQVFNSYQKSKKQKEEGGTHSLELIEAAEVKQG